MTARATKRLLPLAFATVVAVAVFAGAANGRADMVGFVAGPSRVVQGNPATVAMNVAPAGARCSISVRYKSGAKQKGLATVAAAGGRASWTWTIPRLVQPGPHARACYVRWRRERIANADGHRAGPSAEDRRRADRLVGAAVLVRRHRRQLGRHPPEQVEDTRTRRTSGPLNFVMADNRLIGSATVRDLGHRRRQQAVTGGELTVPG